MSLTEKIESGTAAVAVMGLGYVGLPLLAAFHAAGFRVLGLDNDPEKIAALGRGENYLKHLGGNLVADMLKAGRFEATGDAGRLGEADAIISCVPTPLGEHLEPDLSFVEACADDIARTLRPGQLVVLESSTYPGTTREVMLPRLSAGGLKCGRDFFLAYSPEREDPGRKDYSTKTIPKLVGGIDAESGRVAAALYQRAVRQVVPVASCEVAEAAKLLENIYRSVNIALVNEMKTILSGMGIDIWQVIDAAATKPFGFQPFYPGPGLGGHCIPIDPFYLAWKAREAGMPTRFIELAGEINRAMPDYVVRKLVAALNEQGRTPNGARILVLGLAYKPDVDDVRESPSIELIERLRRIGATVDYNDPHVAATHKMRRHDLRMKSVELTPAAIGSYDAVLIATHHSAYDWRMIAENAKLIVDTRGVMRAFTGCKAKIVQA
jgi:UDP-N-acetyl-D-glucosamine dehydrogenase